MTQDEKIAAFLGAARPGPEPVFDAAVMQRLARREFARAVIMAGVAAGVGGLVLWALAPMLATVLVPTAQSLGAGVAILVVTLSLLATGEVMFRRA